jgi:hypothetical protein
MWFMHLVCVGVLAWVALDVWTKVRADRKSIRHATEDRADEAARKGHNPIG